MANRQFTGRMGEGYSKTVKAEKRAEAEARNAAYREREGLGPLNATQITAEDAKLLEGTPAPLEVKVPVEIEEKPKLKAKERRSSESRKRRKRDE